MPQVKFVIECIGNSLCKATATEVGISPASVYHPHQHKYNKWYEVMQVKHNKNFVVIDLHHLISFVILTIAHTTGMNHLKIPHQQLGEMRSLYKLVSTCAGQWTKSHVLFTPLSICSVGDMKAVPQLHFCSWEVTAAFIWPSAEMIKCSMACPHITKE